MGIIKSRIVSPLVIGAIAIQTGFFETKRAQYINTIYETLKLPAHKLNLKQPYPFLNQKDLLFTVASILVTDNPALKGRQTRWSK